MDKCRINIAIIEPSHIIYEGLSNILLRSERHFHLYRIDDLDEINTLLLKNNLDIVIINPSQIQNRLKAFKNLKKTAAKIYWLCIVYTFFENKLLSLFDETFTVTDSPEFITQRIAKLVDTNCHCNNTFQKEQLTERETDVLFQLVQGLSNKEIADKLNISIHTVVSHRKNITQKTGIKSQSGLTIYAITKKIISIDSFPL
jgi:DNA-binding CsgD family transcriptional regulator